MSLRCRWLWTLVAIVLYSALTGGGNAAFADSPTCEPAKLAQKYPSLAGKTIKVSVAGDNKPFSFRDTKDFDHLTGLVPDYARAVFKCLGVPFEFDVATFSGGIAAVSAGQSDLVWSAVYYTPERAKIIDFVLYMKGASGGVVLKGNPKKINSLDDLCGHPAVAQIGSLEAVQLQETNTACMKSGKPAVDVVTSPDRSSALRLLQDGRTDLYLGIGIKEAYDDSLFNLVFLYTSDIKIGIGTGKGNAPLEHALADALAAVQADGTERKLYDTYEIDPSLTLAPSILTQ